MSGPHDVMSGPHEGTFEELRAQLQETAATFADGPDALEGILLGIVEDVDRAVREPLEIFPVCHHSPASALAMARRLREKQPKVVYLELCEDLEPLLTELRNCKLPVALQAFASEIEGFPPEWSPLSVVAPITEASAEYQAIAYALDTPGVELVLVDRSSDHVFQWDARGSHTDDAAEPGGPAEGRTRPARTRHPPRKRPRCTATRSVWRSATCAHASPSWRSTCCATAGCGTGRSGGTSTSNCRSVTATTTPTARSCS